ncbi:MAG: hypothetical protein NUW01_02450 [Gemmatimonadaceae bacterium]|nr:hypothetical protein [Gemmatimonadaceae bacterium]
MKTHPIATTLGLVLALAGAANAQDRNTIRQLGPITARAAEPVAAIGIRPLPSGVLVNDAPRRRLVLFDDQLSTFTVVADSTSATGNAYSGRLGGLLAYKGDSSLFTDPASLSMLVIDPAGKVARVMSMPGARDAGLLAGAMGGAAYDGKGGLVYRGMFPLRRAPGATGVNVGPPEIPDSAPILRIDLATRRLDTLGFIKTPKVKMEISTGEDGRVSMRSLLNPLPVVDDWTALPDGSIAFIRGRDYHVDWIGPDGSRTSSAKIPFDWQRLSDDDKVAFLDSLRAARERMGDGAQGLVAVGSALGVSEAAIDAVGPRIQILTPLGTPVGPGGGGGARQGARQDARQGVRQAEAAASGQRLNTNVDFVDPSVLPDYKPAFFAGSVRVDPHGNLWIRTIPTKAITGGPVYDVIDRQGVLVERVQIPKGRTIVGFGPGDVVYLSVREERVSYLEKATVR